MVMNASNDKLTDPIVDLSPKSLKLLKVFTPTGDHPIAQFSTPCELVILKGMRVTAGFTLGILAWDRGDRETAAKRYSESLNLAETYPEFVHPPVGDRPLEFNRWVATDVWMYRENLHILFNNDIVNTAVRGGVPTGRRSIIRANNAKIEGTGSVSLSDSFTLATSVCGMCGIRSATLKRCSSCKETFCESGLVFRLSLFLIVYHPK